MFRRRWYCKILIVRFLKLHLPWDKCLEILQNRPLLLYLIIYYYCYYFIIFFLSPLCAHSRTVSNKSFKSPPYRFNLYKFERFVLYCIVVFYTYTVCIRFIVNVNDELYAFFVHRDLCSESLKFEIFYV